jgi:hypothetical protein
MEEYASALSQVSKSLPYRLEEDREFLPKADLERLVQVVKELQNVEGDETEGAARIMIRHFAPQLLKSLKQLGVDGS